MKKIILLLLYCALLVWCFTACGTRKTISYADMVLYSSHQLATPYPDSLLWQVKELDGYSLYWWDATLGEYVIVDFSLNK